MRENVVEDGQIKRGRSFMIIHADICEREVALVCAGREGQTDVEVSEFAR